MGLLAGVAAVEITPPVGTMLAGFAARDHGAERVHDALHSKALVLDDGATRVCLITNDLIGLPGELVELIRGEVERTTGIPGANVMVNCSHTHSGPVLREGELPGVVARQVAGVARMAAERLAPARVGGGRGPVQVGINRRELRDGRIVLGRDASKPVAPWVDVLRVDTAEGAPLATLFMHACHPVTRAENSYEISADFPGVAQRLVEGVYPGTTAMFGQGCSGNINSEPVRGTWEDGRRLGTMLGGEVVKVRETIATTDEARLAVTHERVELPLQRIPPMEQVEREIAAAEKALAEAEGRSSAAATNMYKAFLATWRKLREMKEREEELEPMVFPLQGIAVGDTALMALPGEVFVEYALHAEEVSPFGQTLCLGCSNGSGTYVPTAAALEDGGYEVSFTPLWWGRLPFAAEMEGVLRDGIGRVLGRLRG
ncbi:MAG: hypothetical protein ABFE08_08330 [Armatimonadia bacterium]